MIKLIPISYLNEVCFLSLNEDDKKYTMCLKMAQEDLEDVIGKQFYDEIETQYQAEFTADNDTLYEDYIKDFLAWKTYFHYLKFANVAATPTGIREFNDENSSIATDVKMYSLEKNIVARADRYKFKMINFLNNAQANDSTKYPLWENCRKEEFSFGFTAIQKDNDALISVNKTIQTQE